MRQGKWINGKRLRVLKMTQPQFARWLTERTGLSVNAQMVARVENCGAIDTRKQLTPHYKITNLLNEIS